MLELSRMFFIGTCKSQTCPLGISRWTGPGAAALDARLKQTSCSGARCLQQPLNSASSTLASKVKCSASQQNAQETIYLLYLVCFSNEPLAFAFCLFPRYPPLHSHDFYKPIKPGLTWPPMNNVYMLCVCEGVAKSFFTESSLRITEARKELWTQRPKEQSGHVQNFLPKRFQANCILGSILCVESDS